MAPKKRFWAVGEMHTRLPRLGLEPTDSEMRNTRESCQTHPSSAVIASFARQVYRHDTIELSLLLRKLSLEMTFNLFTTQPVSGIGQYDRIDDLIPFGLRGDKRAVFWQYLVNELHFSAVLKCFDPLFVGHFRILQR